MNNPNRFLAYSILDALNGRSSVVRKINVMYVSIDTNALNRNKRYGNLKNSKSHIMCIIDPAEKNSSRRCVIEPWKKPRINWMFEINLTSKRLELQIATFYFLWSINSSLDFASLKVRKKFEFIIYTDMIILYNFLGLILYS